MRGEVLAGLFVAAFIVFVWSLKAGAQGLSVISLAVVIGTVVTHVSGQKTGGQLKSEGRPRGDRKG